MSQIVREHHGAICVLRLNRPEKLNALSNDLLSDLMAALGEAELNPRIHAVIITGTGRAFSAGADIAGFAPHMKAGPRMAVAHFLRPGQRMTRLVETFPKPIIAAVNGLAYGGGCELVEAAHMAIAGRSAAFSKSEINIGIVPTFGGTQRLPRNVGRKAAIELILTGREFGAAEALRLGLVNRVVDDEAVLEESVALAMRVAAKPPLTVAAALSAIHRGLDASIDDGLAIEEAAFASIVPTNDAQEGVSAFVEKRRPHFVGA
ncbi:enoyl-CoA hydratase-related protein [Sabulicella glaciei]|uniref:Enoyl-CoA hydratase-related protein n=1 Tax=Sabulicella glaciei TaxID=2984948 RepID=A0ABT3NZE0_9PROT|nr:enoyl-CoA hydratase-related protein [Roseococcus sp. MDT2-1-1]